jgi:hypothetical protein
MKMTDIASCYAKYIDDPKAPQALRSFLAAACQGTSAANLSTLFATLRRDVAGRGPDGVVALPAGKRVRVVEAGLFGDLGVTSDANSLRDEVRVAVAELEKFSTVAGVSAAGELF